MFRRLLPVLVVATIAAACGGSSSPSSPASPTGSPDVRQQLTLAPGQTVTVPSTALTVRFEGVTNDSRCPADALCIQLGHAEAVFSATEAGRGDTRVALRTIGDQTVARVGAYRLQLETLQPYPYANRAIDPSEYRATLVVERP